MRRTLKRVRCGERGQSAVELAGVIPILVIVLLLLIQGIAAVTAASEIRNAARDGARALEAGRSARPAVQSSLADWIDLRAVSSCGPGCVRVTGQVPLGIPGIVEVTHVTLSSEATFPTRRRTV